MKNSRPRIKFAQIPHSIARYIETLTNPTASSLLSLLTRKTIGFGQGYVEFSFRQLAALLGVGTRAICKASAILVKLGVIIRNRPPGCSYQWRVVLEKEEVLADPNHVYAVRAASEYRGGDKIDRSGGIRSIVPDPQERSILSPHPIPEQKKHDKIDPLSLSIEQKTEPLKKVIKENNTKKQHQACSRLDGSGSSKTTQSAPESESATKPLASRSDDEPLHKKLLRELKKHGVNQRVARKLCRENDHDLIQSVLEAVPQLSGIRNLPGYLVSAIQDGGYEQNLPSQPTQDAQPPNSPSAKTTGQRRYVIKTEIDAPITYRSAEETKAEQEALEAQKQQQEQTYREKGKLLLERFKALSEDLQYRLKLAASVHLSKIIPSSGNREQMLKDQTFQRLANRTVLEQFFEWVDQGLDQHQALSHLESTAMAA